MIVLQNTGGYVAVQINMVGEGKTANTSAVEGPILGFEYRRGGLRAITLFKRIPGAIFRIKDPASKSWLDEAGNTYSTWQLAVAELWSVHDERNRQKQPDALVKQDGPIDSDPAACDGFRVGPVAAEMDRAPVAWKPSTR